MKKNHVLPLALSLLLAGTASAATPASAPPAKPAPQAAKPAFDVDAQIKAMRDMHEKMIHATPEQRRALQNEHMKLMQDSMSMMNHMGGCGMMGGPQGCGPQGGPQGGPRNGPQGGPGMMGARPGPGRDMEQRMDMMQNMMQMMMDRLDQAPPAK
ncbi:hypothetical protein H3H36_01340 [Duganella sp. FT3S]|uniref:Signal recognition particle subunit FFH/SRP54 (Srp54) n=1 Tax=Rugamonas fusca TaxID=2758568 RepID=A0A7W2I552_9BURK|nr:hypothetical protein [Rugamonas fusca]MBA5604007.1 hypothetical protein [Rugamonas fusca]